MADSRSPIQRQLSVDDKAKLIEFAKQELGVSTLPAKISKMVQNIALFSNELKNAKRDISQTIQIFKERELPEKEKTIFKDVEMKADTAPNSLGAWIGEDETLTIATRPVDMSGYKSLKPGKTFILYTTSLGGCLGVTGLGNGQIFLAHFDPDQLEKQKQRNIFIEHIKQKIGTATLHFASTALATQYNQTFIAELNAAGFTIGQQDNQQRLAINGRTGEIMHDFNMDELKL